MPAAVHAGNYGLMQIRLGTARAMGYAGDADGLLDPDTNLTYAVKYLAGAYRAAGCDADRAVSYYQRGYYGAAKRECGADSRRRSCASGAVGAGGAARRRAEPLMSSSRRWSAPRPSRRRSPVRLRRGRSGLSSRSRIAPPPAQPAEAARSTPVDPASADQDRSPLAPEPAAKLELAAVPLPPARPELDAIGEARRSAGAPTLPSARHEAHRASDGQGRSNQPAIRPAS